MKTSSKKAKGCKVPVTVELDGEEIKSVIKKTEKQFLNNSRIEGFRIGKAPIDLVRKVYGKMIEEEINSSAITENIRPAIEKEQLKAIDVAEIRDFKRDDNGASWTLDVEVEPEFELPEYKGLKIAPAKVEVEEEEIEDQLKSLKRAYSSFEESKEGDVACDDDYVEIDFEGKIDGKSVGEVCGEAKSISEGKGFWARIGSGYFISEVTEALRGMKVGEKKEGIAVKFGKEGQPEGLAGKDALYNVEVKSIRKFVPVSDEDFLKRVNKESMEQVREDFRKRMIAMKESQEEARRQKEVSDALLAKCDFEVPQSVVNQIQVNIIEDYARRAQYSGISPEDIKKHTEDIKKDIEKQAIDQARLYYIMGKIAEKENIESRKEGFAKEVYDKILSYAE